ncbi:hypothetical protein BK133_07580 [Paenibacillus sp. FSL H8-0548]|nr:hypothetical protein BK133_07580 [Paenibacillus sp. FSL H8-0548]
MLLTLGMMAGVISGTVLGFAMKLLEQMTGSAVYVLLLNIDFVKWVPDGLNEQLEFALHLIVSIPLAIIYLALLSIWRSPVVLSFGMSIAAACCTWIPLTQLSVRTPDMSDLTALFWWLMGHFLYGAVLACFGVFWLRRGGEEG